MNAHIQDWAMDRNTSIEIAEAIFDMVFQPYGPWLAHNIWKDPYDKEVVKVARACGGIEAIGLVWGDQTLGDMIDDRGLWDQI